MMLSVIIVSNSFKKELKEMTQNCINSALLGDIKKEIILIESSKEEFLNVTKTIYIKQEFNYNVFLNIGIKESKNEYIALCNNDLVFSKEWDKIVTIMSENNILSASPFSVLKSGHNTKHKFNSGVHYGYRIGHQLLGWCIVINRKLLDIIGCLDETDTWCADIVYSKQLQKNNIKHALVTDCVVNHLRNKTLKLVNKEELKHLNFDLKE